MLHWGIGCLGNGYDKVVGALSDNSALMRCRRPLSYLINTLYDTCKCFILDKPTAGVNDLIKEQ